MPELRMRLAVRPTFFVLLATLLFVGALGRAAAQPQDPAAGQSAAGPAATPENAEIDALIGILEDDAARARLIERLRVAAEPTAAEPSDTFASRLAGYTRGAAAVTLGALSALGELVRQAGGVFTGAVDVDISALRTILLGIALLIAATFTMYGLLRVAFRSLANRLSAKAANGDLIDRI
jgi:small conductance mechanosensitive channel